MWGGGGLHVELTNDLQTLITSLLNAKAAKDVPRFGKMGRKIECEIC